MQIRIDKLHAENEKWKKTALDLAKQIEELTGLKREAKRKVPQKQSSKKRRGSLVDETKVCIHVVFILEIKTKKDVRLENYMAHKIPVYGILEVLNKFIDHL